MISVSATATAKAGTARRVSHSDKVGRCAMREWKEKYAPQSMDDDNWHPLFCEALDKTSYVEYVLDELLAAGKSEYEELRRVFRKEVERIEKRLERYAGRDASRD